MNKRVQILERIRVHGWHGERGEAYKLASEHRIGLDAYSVAFGNGERQRANGVACKCSRCVSVSNKPA